MMIKVCGMKNPGQISELSTLGVDLAGLIFYEGSKRFVNADPDSVRSSASIKKIGVFVNEKIEEVLRICREYELYGVQLHGDEDPAYCRAIKEAVVVIKVFRLKGDENIDEMTEPFMDAADYFLFDNGTSGYGGSGKKFNWDLLQTSAIAKPFFLSGGIGPEDADIIMKFSHPYFKGIDLNSGFEIEPGNKNMEMLKAFINEIRKK